MPSKLQTYMQMADEAQRQITGSYRGWTGFLTTAARLYKYPYAEQVMIHAQRPDATACAEYDFWNEKMGRYVRRGSKGIALIDSSGERPRLRYVFDVSDTGGREFPKSRYLWEYREEHADAVSAMLESRYGVDGKGGLPDQLERIASQLAEEYWRDYKRDILAIVDDSFLYGYDEFNVGAAFQSAAAVSIAYSLMSRCGLEADDRFEHEDFLSIFDFNTPEAAAELGTAVSRINGEVLRQIEVTIKNYEREKLAERSHSHDRTDLHQERGLPDSRPDAERDAGGRETPGQVRETAQELPSGAQTGAVQPSGAVGEAVPASAGDRRDGEPEAGADDAGADEVGGRDGGSESPRSDEMGGADEQPESAGGGDHPQRAGVQLTNDAPEAEPAQPPIPQAYQLSLFPTEDEQIAYIAEAESYTPSAFSMSVPQSDIDHILRMEGNADHARMKIATEFSKGKSVEEIAAFLQSSFHGGNGMVTENGRYSAWYAEDGIHIANGDAARYLTSAKVVSWQEAAERIGQLLTQGEYATNVELAEAPGHERAELAQAVWYLRQDLSEKARAQGYLSCLSDMRGGGFPEETERLAERLRDPAFREVLMDDFAQLRSDYREDRSLLRFHYHKPDKIEQGLRELSLPRREYRTEMAELPAVQRFITEDEIAATLTRGSNIEGSKGRIYAYFKEKHSPKEQADFLRTEYGIGGSSHAVSGASHSGEDHSGKGVSLKKQDCPEIQLNWANVAKRISELIRKDRFLTPEEKARFEQLQRQTAARSAAWNDYNAVKEAHPDDLVLFQVGDFFELYGEDAKQASGLLNMNLTTRNIPGAGRVEMCGVPAHSLERYIEELRDKYDVTIAAAQETGTERRVYTLRSVDHEAEAAIDAYEAEFGADGTRVFRDPAAEQAQPTVQELFERYRLSVGNALSKDEAFLNACRNSDRQNAYLEGAAAIRRIVMASEDLQLTRLYFDMPSFHNRLHQELLDELYPTLATTITPSPYKVTQEDIDAALQSWNGKIESKQAVVRYMAQHGRERETAAWLAREYGLKDTSKPLQISVGNSEPVTLSWAKVQRRIAQLIREDKFFTEQEKSLLENNPDYRLLGRLRADCEYFLGAGNRAEKHLWAGSVYAQIVKMRELYDALPQKPEWLTKEMIDDYAERMAPRYQVVAYHHFENGFDEKRDYQTLEEAEKAAQGYVDGAMESDGFAYDGAAIYDQQARKYLRIYGDYPDERAHAEVAGREPTAETIIPADRFHVVSLDRGFRTLYAVWDDETHGYHVDADGVTEEFTSEWQAEAYRLELQGQAEQALIERAKGLISDFCRSEYGSEADFSDPAKIGVAYTAVTDDEIPIQVNIDLVNYRLERYLDDEHLETRQYASLQELITNELENLDFSDLIHVSDEDVEQYRWHEPEEAVTDVPETAPVPQREQFPYSVGDTVYLEDGKPYIIESIGVFDITLSDPTLFYPISRAESRESFARLMERYPQPEKTAAENTAVPEKEPNHTYTEETVAVYPADKNNLPYDVEIRTLRIDEPEHDPPASLPPAENFRILDDDLGTGGAKEKFWRNIKAIATLKQIEAEGRNATPEEQHILSQYVGWGGLADAFDPDKAGWRVEYDELKGVLSPEEYAAARASTERANAYKILEDTLNLRDVRIYDTKHDADGRERRVLNSKETTLAQQKQQAIKDAFRDWIWRDPDRRHTLVARYNELFNSTRPREYDGSHITFVGMNPEIRLREHQLNAVAHVIYGGNTLLAHEVGAGKTFEMVAAAMESKRLGLCHKSLFVVPNHLTEQWSGEFLRLYPSANILVATKKDFEPKNRKKFCARIATGEYDAVIIGHSQFEKIPVSMERQQRLLAEQIFEVEEGLRELKSQRAERFTIKSLERTKRGLEAKLKKLQDSSRKDDVVTFEQLGVDRLYVDEAHNYKNLFLYTKMRNVAGLSATDAQKSSDMLLKCRYIDEITDSRGVVFATGTPVSNSMTELYTMMRYLQHDAIRGKGLAHFDCWASTFGETQTAIELAPEGTGYRARTRFAKFFNLPELMTLFKEAADIKTSDQLNLPTPTPIYHNEVAQPTEIQKQMVQELSERAARVHAQLVDPGTDNMLKITSDGRKLGLDQRIINPDLPDDPNSKVNRCVDNIHRIWQDGQADRLTQLVFCDLSTPKTGATGAKAAKTAGGNLDSPELHAVERLIDKENPDEPGFTVYDDIREKLVARGIPREQIAFIHEANTETRKKELFAKVRSGQVRVLMGSTFKMGAGMNVQDRLVALHDLDCPWRPGDLEQRSGRIIRQGNRNKEVHIYRYVTESTFDAYLWQTVENKQKFISQIMTSKSPVRSCEDVDETALSYAEIKALCAGDERIKEKMDLDVDVARLKLMKASHRSQQFRLEDNLLRHFPEQIRQNESFVEGFTADMQTLAGHPHPVDGFAGMEVKGDLLTDKDNAGAAILEAFKDAKGLEPVPIGSYRGFAMSLTVEDFGRDFILTLKGKMNHRVTLGKDARGNLTRIDNALNAMPDRLQNVRNTLDALTAQMETAKAELGKPFPQEDELRTKSARLAELNAELNIDDRTPMEQMAEDAPAVQSAKAERPSVLAKLKAPLSQPCAEDKIRHRGKEER